MLINHIIGWLQRFEAGVNGRVFDGDPAKFTSKDPILDFRNAATGLLAGWSKGGLDQVVRLGNAELPGKIVRSMTLTEYLTHGCDLAIAIGQAGLSVRKRSQLFLSERGLRLGSSTGVKENHLVMSSMFLKALRCWTTSSGLADSLSLVQLKTTICRLLVCRMVTRFTPKVY
ncbi:MAG: hypothetical protein M1288_00740 [Actinobacteria bacterium]|nr:hypothetical protein [Actinomycetota bacterium]